MYLRYTRTPVVFVLGCSELWFLRSDWANLAPPSSCQVQRSRAIRCFISVLLPYANASNMVSWSCLDNTVTAIIVSTVRPGLPRPRTRLACERRSTLVHDPRAFWV